MANSKELFQELLAKITLPDREEAAAILYFLLEHRLGLTRQEILTGKPVVPIESLKSDIIRINQHEPVQYIVECAWFRNTIFWVKPGVLIPRPETELLVEEILREQRNVAHTIVDVGVGSGCIAVSLAIEMPQANVIGIDISDRALEVCRENAKRHNVSLQLVKKDILQEALPTGLELDFLVSNPPYIRVLEKKNMEANVLQYEPAEALFVPDDDPLIFYRVLAERGIQSLKSGGKLLVELNAALAQQTLELIQSYGYQQVELIKDLEGKSRILKATR